MAPGSFALLGPTSMHLLQNPDFQHLRRTRSWTLALDAIDRASSLGSAVPDLFVCSSLSEAEARKSDNRSDFLFLPHQADKDWKSRVGIHMENRVVYVGASSNAIPGLAEVEYVFTPGQLDRRQIRGFSRQIESAGFHLIARPQLLQGSFKPFTKGLIAAKFGACVIASLEDEEARLWLGDSYPFYSATSQESDVQEAVLSAMSKFKSDEYFLAVAAVRRALFDSNRDLEILEEFVQTLR